MVWKNIVKIPTLLPKIINNFIAISTSIPMVFSHRSRKILKFVWNHKRDQNNLEKENVCKSCIWQGVDTKNTSYSYNSIAKNSTNVIKNGRGGGQSIQIDIFPKTQKANGQQVLIITDHQGNSNQNHNEVASHLSERLGLNARDISAGWGCGLKGIPVQGWWECSSTITMENSTEVPQKTKTERWHATIPLLGI